MTRPLAAVCTALLAALAGAACGDNLSPRAMLDDDDDDVVIYDAAPGDDAGDDDDDDDDDDADGAPADAAGTTDAAIAADAGPGDPDAAVPPDAGPLGVCGDDTLESGEACDDGNVLPGDGCSATCQTTALGACVADFPLSCGESDDWSTLDAGTTDAVNTWSCVSWNESGPEYTYAFVSATDAHVTVSVTTGAGVDLDVFVVDGQTQSCGPEACIEGDDTDAIFDADAGHLYFVVIDGYQGAAGTFTIETTCI